MEMEKEGHSEEKRFMMLRKANSRREKEVSYMYIYILTMLEANTLGADFKDEKGKVYFFSFHGSLSFISRI